MDSKNVDKQIAQMEDFILQEAKEKASEIMNKANEEFNIEKLQIVEQEKAKIRQEYERKEKAVEIQKKIAHSNEINKSRLQVLMSRDKVLSEVKHEVRARLATLCSNAPAYRKLMHDLMLQAMFRLSESSVVVRAREMDAGLVRELISEVQASYQKLCGKACTIELSSSYLSPPPNPSQEGAPSCCGGIVMLTTDGRIVCDNTLDARERIVVQQKLPDFKKGLFGASANRKHLD